MTASSKRWNRVQLGAERALARLFPFWERLGIHVTLNHFYSAIPDSRMLPDDLWTRRSDMVGVTIEDAPQLQLLQDITRFQAEYAAFPRLSSGKQGRFYLDNKTFVSVDAEVLYSFVRILQPERIIEIGSGQSTYLMADAIVRNRNEGRPCELVVIDPYPADPVRAGIEGVSEVITKRVQDVPLSVFERLEANDVLFVDTSHVLRIGGDVQYEFLEVIPRVAPGVNVQIHDVFLPFEYPRSWVMHDRLFYNEQYLLQALLAFNPEFEVIWAGAYMSATYPDRLEAAFPSYEPGSTIPGSFWIRRRQTSAEA